MNNVISINYWVELKLHDAQRSELDEVGDFGLRSYRTPPSLLRAAGFVVRTETPIDI